ncbi:glycosyl transferase, group 1 family [Desulfosarcina variabilis str. Montpellier]|uniref:glycosyltransferase n=1 Tax=Desulfosarcina variabilis TaxID=2300 RepID=UPI003AFB122A
MKNIFLFDPTCLYYRQQIYLHFINEFKKYDLNLTVYYDAKKTDINLKGFVPIKYSFFKFFKLHYLKKPNVSIFHIWLRYKFSLPFLIFCKFFLETKTIVWSKGINISRIDRSIMNNFYYLRQIFADSLILYSNFEKQFIKASQKKVFIANNTINQYVYKTDLSDYKNIKAKYGISNEKIVLFVGRIEKRKNLDILIKAFDDDFRDHALLIVGPGLPNELKDVILKKDNIFYLGPIYDNKILSEIYSISYLFCIPGEIGLGLNEAFLFGLPVITTYIRPTSEMYLLFNDHVNGMLVESGNIKDLKNKLMKLINNDELYIKLSKNAKKTFYDKGKIEYMFKGFYDSVKFVMG